MTVSNRLFFLRIHGRTANKSLGVSEGDIARRNAVAQVVGNDLHSSMLKDGYTGVCCTQVDTDGWCVPGHCILESTAYREKLSLRYHGNHVISLGSLGLNMAAASLRRSLKLALGRSRSRLLLLSCARCVRRLMSSQYVDSWQYVDDGENEGWM